jgi:hypothetical protein
MNRNLEIMMAHNLPGRVRLRLSHALKDPYNTIRNIEGHAGIKHIIYTATTQNILVTFDRRSITLEEIIIRVALAFSAEHELAATTIKASQPQTSLSELSFLSGMTLIAGHILRLLSTESRTTHIVKIISAIATLISVLEHTYSDVKQTGSFHPEVLSVGYLLASFIRKNQLKGATIAWITTFARHLLEAPTKELKIEAEAIDPECDENQCEFEATIYNQQLSAAPSTLLARLPRFLFGLYSDMNTKIEDRIFREIWKLSNDREQVLEGIENNSKGIRLNIVR